MAAANPLHESIACPRKNDAINTIVANIFPAIAVGWFARESAGCNKTSALFLA